jgi:pimeloyl-ACP methyl ester carboxylesterase
MATRAVLLVHGAWHGGWCWDEIIEPLRRLGLRPITVDLPMTSLADDVDCVRQAIAAVGEPMILCGHSYGGAVVTEAGAGQPLVERLIYVCAVVPDRGETTLLPGDPRAGQPSDSILRVEPGQATGLFYGTSPAEQARVASSRLRPLSLACFSATAQAAAWRERPSTYVMTARDRALPIDRQEAYANRCTEVVHWDCDHSPFYSMPQDLAALIAARAALPATLR